MVMRRRRKVIPTRGELKLGCRMGGILWKIGFRRLLLSSFEDIFMCLLLLLLLMVVVVVLPAYTY